MTPREAYLAALAPHIASAGGRRALCRLMGVAPSAPVDRASLDWLTKASGALGVRVVLTVETDGTATATASK